MGYDGGPGWSPFLSLRGEGSLGARARPGLGGPSAGQGCRPTGLRGASLQRVGKPGACLPAGK